MNFAMTKNGLIWKPGKGLGGGLVTPPIIMKSMFYSHYRAWGWAGIVLILCAFVGCSKREHVPDKVETQNTQQSEISFATESKVSIRQLADLDLTYFLMHAQIVAESPLPHLLPREMKYAYRIMGSTEQGDCMLTCPRSIILVAISNYNDYRDGHIRLYRIDGARFWHFSRVEEFKGEEDNGYFLSFRFASIAHPMQPEIYIAKIGFDRAVVEHGPPGIPKPAHRFEPLFKKDSTQVFRITFRQGDIFQLYNFEGDDPSISGDDDAWSADVKAAIATNYWKDVGGNMKIGFRESDVLEIFDEQSH
jgi:hypothetical protein